MNEVVVWRKVVEKAERSGLILKLSNLISPHRCLTRSIESQVIYNTTTSSLTSLQVLTAINLYHYHTLARKPHSSSLRSTHVARTAPTELLRRRTPELPGGATKPRSDQIISHRLQYKHRSDCSSRSIGGSDGGGRADWRRLSSSV